MTQGTVRTKDRARLTIYSPGMDKDIDNTILSCKLCQDSVPSQQKEPITLKPTPQRPFQEITAYFCSHAGQQYLITVHCFSDWLEITPMMTNTTTRKLVSALKLSFCCTGAPDKVWAHQGPQFTSQAFRKFAKQWGFEYVTSTPRYPQSNGKAKSYGKVHEKDHPISMAWAVPRQEQVGPSITAILQHPITQKLYGRPIQDTLPAHRRAFSPE